MTESGTNTLAGLKLAELKKMASDMGLKGISTMRKGALIEAITASARPTRRTSTDHTKGTQQPQAEQPELLRPRATETPQVARSESTEHAGKPQPKVEQSMTDSSGEGTRNRRRRERNRDRDRDKSSQEATNEEVGERLALALGQPASTPSLPPASSGASNRFEEEGEGGRRSRRRRNRDRQNRRNRGSAGFDRFDSEPTVAEDDVLAAVSGIVDILDNYAFVQTEKPEE